MASEKKIQPINTDNENDLKDLTDSQSDVAESNLIPDKTERRGRQSGVPEHQHNGIDLDKIRVEDIKGFIEVVFAVPTHIPRNIFDQIKFYDNAGTPELYVFNYVTQTWHVFTGV